MLFIPIGFFLSKLFQRKSILLTIIGAFIISCLIEILQLISMRGMFEYDDIINNTFGAFLGWIVYKLCKEKNEIPLSVIFVTILIVACFTNSRPVESVNRILCFQAEKTENGVEGFAFRYGKDTPEKYIVLLKSTKSGRIKNTNGEYCIQRDDVGEYFECDFDYSICGFRLRDLIVDDDEYEFILSYNTLLQIPTGVYISSEGVHYAQELDFEYPSLNENFITQGILRVYNPENHCWIYQYKEALYWVVDHNFVFDNDGSTYITFILWTTQLSRLPIEKQIIGWDNRSGYFEDYEIKGEFGRFRVMKRELPLDYSITSIVTGCHNGKEWICQEYFSPYYDFFNSL